MFDNSLVNLLFQLIFLFIVSIIIRLYFVGKIVSASLGFWVGWLSLILSSLYCEFKGWVEIGVMSVDYLSTMFYGTFFGFLISDLFIKPKSHIYIEEKILYRSKLIFDNYSKKLLYSLLILGSISLAITISKVGLGGDFLISARYIYNTESNVNYSLLAQITAHFSALIWVLLVIKAILDYKYGLDLTGLFLVMLYGLPFFLSTASRTFLLGYPLTYLAGYLLCGTFMIKEKSTFKPDMIKVCSLFFICLLIFAVIGFFRGGYGDEIDLLYTVLIWPVSTMAAMDTWVTSATINSNLSHGFYTFSWPFDIIRRLNLYDFRSEIATINTNLDYFEKSGNSSGVVPRSMLPDLIFDFGADNIFIASLVVGFLLQSFTSFAGKSIFFQVLAVNSFIAAFSTIQGSPFGSNFFATLFWSYLLSKIIQKKIKYNNINF